MKITKHEMLVTIRPYYNINQVYSINDIKSQHKGHWFDKETMRFFNTKVVSNVYPSIGKVFFVSSEKFDNKSPRLYTVRSFDLSDGSVNTVGDFQEFPTKIQAETQALKLAYSLI